jgi:hypothetical protein
MRLEVPKELTYWLTYSRVQDIIWKADCHSARQKNLTFLWNPKGHHRVDKSPPLDPILSQPNPVRPIDPCLPKVHFWLDCTYPAETPNVPGTKSHGPFSNA